MSKDIKELTLEEIIDAAMKEVKETPAVKTASEKPKVKQYTSNIADCLSKLASLQTQMTN